MSEAVLELGKVEGVLNAAGVTGGRAAQRVERLVKQRDEAWIEMKTARELRKRAGDRLHDFKSASCADSVQGEAAWKQRAESAEAALGARQGRDEEIAEILNAAGVQLNGEGIQGPGGPRMNRIRVKMLASERDAALANSSGFDLQAREFFARAEDAEKALADLLEQNETHAALGDVKLERDAALAELRLLKEDLKAMGRLSKLAFSLVMGDMDPEDMQDGDGGCTDES